jgi:hypothetical protein
VKETLITLESKSTIAAGAWVFLRSTQFYPVSISHGLLPWAQNIGKGRMDECS